jgi:hypothetical protein
MIINNKELGETWELIKAASDSSKEKRELIDIELKYLAKEKVKKDNKKNIYLDGYGKEYTKEETGIMNSKIRAKAHKITNDIKLVNQFMFAQGHNWPLENNKEDTKGLDYLMGTDPNEKI